MEKLINVLLAIWNWYENTTVREGDPEEIAGLKRCELGMVKTSACFLVAEIAYVWLESPVPNKASVLASSLMQIALSLQQGLAFVMAGLAVAFACYFVKAIYLHRIVSGYD